MQWPWEDSGGLCEWLQYLRSILGENCIKGKHLWNSNNASPVTCIGRPTCRWIIKRDLLFSRVYLQEGHGFGCFMCSLRRTNPYHHFHLQELRRKRQPEFPATDKRMQSVPPKPTPPPMTRSFVIFRCVRTSVGQNQSQIFQPGFHPGVFNELSFKRCTSSLQLTLFQFYHFNL